MPLDDAFLNDIVAHPADDAPRLIYADWLDEQDDPEARRLAEFIRVQMALEQPPPEGPALWQLRRREAELLRQGRAAWLGGVPELVLRESFRRGFIHSVMMDCAQFLERAGELLAMAPVQGLHLRAPYQAGAEEHDPLLAVAACPHLRQIAHLRLEVPLRAAGARALADSPHLGALSELEVDWVEPGLDLRPLLEAPWCERLRSLSLVARGFTPGQIAALAESPRLAGLRTLRLHSQGGGLAGAVDVLAASPHLSRLRALHLRDEAVLPPAAMRALAGATFAGSLEELNLSGNLIGNDSLRAWAERVNAPRLRRLDLVNARLTGPGFEALACGRGTPALARLNLRSNVIGGSGLAALARPDRLPALRVLLLHFNGVTDHGFAALAHAGRLRELVWLELIGNRLTDSGAAAMRYLPDLGRLAKLELARNDINPRTQQALHARFGDAVLF